MYREDFEDGLVKWVMTMSEINLYENHDSETTLRDFEERVGMCFRNEIEIWYRRGDKYHSPFQNWYDGIRIEYNEEVDIWESVSIGFERGVYEEEPYTEYSIEKPMRITDHLVTTINGNYRVNETAEPDVWLWRWVTQYNFSQDSSVKLTAEQTSEGRHNLTMLFSWPVKDNIDLYLLFNDYKTDEEDVCGAFFKVVYRF